MKTIPLTRRQVAMVDDDDYEWLLQWKWHATIYSGRFYAKHYSGVLMHRVILDAPRGVQVDHRNRNGLDNQRANLRLSTFSQNGANSFPRGGRSGFKGVVRCGSKWGVHTRHMGQDVWIRSFNTPREAALAYDVKAVELWGEFALTNAQLGLL